MLKNTVPGVVKSILGFVKANGAQLTTAGIVLGVVGAVIFAVKAGKETQKDIEELTDENFGERPELKTIVKTVWKHYIPVVFLLITAIGGMIWNNERLLKRCAALSSAYALTSSYLEDYVQSTKETMSPRKEQTIRDATIEKQFQRAESTKFEAAPRGIVETGKGTVLFYDCCTGYRFRSSRDAVLSGIASLNNIFKDDNEITLDDYIDAITSGRVKRYGNIGNYLGVKRDRTLDDRDLNIDITSTGITQDGEPYIAVRMDNYLINLVNG